MLEAWSKRQTQHVHVPVERHHGRLADDEVTEGLWQDLAELVLALEAGGEEDEVGLHLGAVVEDHAVLGEAPAGGGPLEADEAAVRHVEEALWEDGHLAAGVVLDEGVIWRPTVLAQRQLP